MTAGPPDQRRIRVLIFEPYPMDRIGGNLRTLLYILRFIDRRQFEIVVVSPMQTSLVEEVRAEGVECIVVEPPGSVGRYGGKALRDSIVGRFRNIVALIAYNVTIARTLRERKIDVVYANSIRAVLFVGLASRLAGAKLLWYIKGELNNPWLDRYGFMVADKVLFFCESNRDDKYPGLISRCRDKIGILRIGLDLAAMDAVLAHDHEPLEIELGVTRASVNTVVIAQVYRPKGQHVAIEALSRIVTRHPNLRLYIVGDHVIDEYRGYRDELEALVKARGLESHVVFTGWRRDALDIIGTMDIVLHPSFSEGFGRAVLESMALGKPVIASRVGGLREIIKSGTNGFLVDPGDVDQLASRWIELIESPEKRATFGREARLEVQRHYLLQDKIEKLADIWADLAVAN